MQKKVPKEVFEKIPIGISMNLTGGPSLDFRLGAMWANILDYESDDLLPKAEEGTSFKERTAVQQQDAANRFMAGNCNLL